MSHLDSLYNELRTALLLLKKTWQCYQTANDTHMANKCMHLYLRARDVVVQIIFSIKMLCDAYMLANFGKKEVAVTMWESILYSITAHNTAATIALTELYNLSRNDTLPPEDDKLRKFIREIEKRHIMEADKIATMAVEGKISVEKILAELKCI